MVEMLKLKTQIKIYLDHMDLTAAKLARLSGVSKQTISYWQSGGSPRGLEQLKSVATALGTTVDNLCFGDGVDVEQKPTRDRALELMFGDRDEWLSGFFEVKIRRIKK